MKPEDETTPSIEQHLETAHQNLQQTMSMAEAKMGQELERAEDAARKCCAIILLGRHAWLEFQDI